VLLKAHKIPFLAIDVATDDKARSIWGRRSGGKKLPGLVKDGEVLGNLEDIEEWNEYGELKSRLLSPDQLSSLLSSPTTSSTASKPAGLNTSVDTTPVPGLPAPEPAPNPMAAAMSGLAAEAAAAASEKKKNVSSK